jgi:HEAT repeat protein
MGIFDFLLGGSVELVRQLRHRDPAVRRKAALALSKAPDARAVRALIELVKDVRPENGHVRETAAYALGKTGDARAVGPLVRLMMDTALTSQRSVAFTAAKSLRVLGWEPRNAAERAVCAMVEKRPALAAAQGAAVLEGFLRQEDATEEGQAIVLSALLTSPELDKPDLAPIRQVSPATWQLLQSWLEDAALWRSGSSSAASKRERLVEAFGPRAVEPLAQLLLQGGWEGVRAAATLAEMGVDAVPPLLRALPQAGPPMRVVVINALRDIGDPSAGAPVAALLADPDEEVRCAALGALGRLDVDAGAELRAVLENSRLSSQTRTFAIEELSRLGQSRDVEAVAQALGDAEVRVPAALALSRRSDPRALPVLLSHLDLAGPEPEQTRRQVKPELDLLVAQAVARLGSPRSIKILLTSIATARAHGMMDEAEAEAVLRPLKQTIAALEDLLERAPSGVERADLEAIVALGSGFELEVQDDRREWAPEVHAYNCSLLQERARHEIERREKDDERNAATNFSGGAESQVRGEPKEAGERHELS